LHEVIFQRDNWAGTRVVDARLPLWGIAQIGRSGA
jgi:hypothetical protein